MYLSVYILCIVLCLYTYYCMYAYIICMECIHTYIHTKTCVCQAFFFPDLTVANTMLFTLQYFSANSKNKDIFLPN